MLLKFRNDSFLLYLFMLLFFVLPFLLIFLLLGEIYNLRFTEFDFLFFFLDFIDFRSEETGRVHHFFFLEFKFLFSNIGLVRLKTG